MSYFSQFGAGTPAKITTYNSGSGTYTPISTNQSWARITLVGGGGGGGGTAYDPGNGYYDKYGVGGAGGGSTLAWVKLNAANYSYSVGAGGNGAPASGSGGSGGSTTFGAFYAGGGYGGNYGFSQVAVNGGSGTVPGGASGMGVEGTPGVPRLPNNQFYGGGASLYGFPNTSPGSGGRGGITRAGGGLAGQPGLIYIEEFVQ